MKQILKPIFEMITGEYIIFENIIYNYIAISIIGVIAYEVAKKLVGKLYNNDIISGKTIGSILHWTIRLIVFIVVFYFFSFSIWLTKFCIKYGNIILICLGIGITFFILFRLVKKYREELKNIRKIIDNKILAIKRRIALFELEKFNQYKTIYLIISLLILIIAISIVSQILYKIDFRITIDNIYSDTGIAIIGMVALIFSLNTYKQQILYRYMNSVMDKILNDKKYDILQYIIITLIAIIFIFMQETIPNGYISTSVYICCILYIFILFGYNLIILSNKLDKVKIIKECEKKVKVTTKCLEREYEIIKKFAIKNNQRVESEIRFIEYFNKIYTAYIQCINMIIRDNINDTIAFEEAMQIYFNIATDRLARRKNRIKQFPEPLLAEVIPTNENDIFIERYILEYLEEYSSIALKEKNRDILSIIQGTYYKLLIAGSDNKYINNNDDIELTVKIILVYYLRNVKDIIRLNNQNLLFETINIIKQIFIRNGNKFVSLINEMYIDDVIEICEIAIEQKSDINLRNAIGMLVIPIQTLLNSENKYKEIILEKIYKGLQVVLRKFIENIEFIKKYNGARLPLNHIFNCLEPISICNIYRNYYNMKIITVENKINKEILYNEEIFEELIEFLEKEENIKNIAFLRKTRYYVTIDVDLNAIFELIIDISLRIINLKDKDLTVEYERVLKRVCILFNKYLVYYDKEMIQCEIDEFYENILERNKNIISTELANLINNMFLLSKMNNLNDEEIELETFAKYISYVIELESDEHKDQKIKKIIEILCKNEFSNEIKLYREIEAYDYLTSKLSYKVNNVFLEYLENDLKIKLEKMEKEEIIQYLERQKIKFDSNLNKESLIEIIFN